MAAVSLAPAAVPAAITFTLTFYMIYFKGAPAGSGDIWEAWMGPNPQTKENQEKRKLQH